MVCRSALFKASKAGWGKAFTLVLPCDYLVDTDGALPMRWVGAVCFLWIVNHLQDLSEGRGNERERENSYNGVSYRSPFPITQSVVFPNS